MDYIDLDKIECEVQKKVNRYRHDAFFHFLVKGHDGIRKTLCQKMIVDHTIVETSIVDGERNAEFYDGKNFVLDILAKDEIGNLYNIEMQCYEITYEEMVRFQLYNFRVLSNEVKRGVSYSKVKPLRQMIINVSQPLPELKEYIHRFVLYDKDYGVAMPYSLYEVYIVQLAFLDMDNINIEEFDELMYLFKNDIPYDKIKVHKNVQEAMDMHIKFNMSQEKYEALRRERDEMTRQFREEAARERAQKQGYEKGVSEGYEKGMSKGYEKGMSKGYEDGKVKGMAQGMAQGMLKSKIEDLMCLYEKKFGSLSQTTKENISKLTIEQVNALILSVFDIETEQQLNEKLQNKT